MIIITDLKPFGHFICVSFLGLMIIAFASSCSSKKNIPSDVIEFNKMKQVLWDDTKAQVYAKEILSKDSLVNDTIWYNDMRSKIFEHYHINKEQYEKSYRYYVQHPDLFIQLTDSIIKQHVEMSNKLNIQKPAIFKESIKKIKKVYE